MSGRPRAKKKPSERSHLFQLLGKRLKCRRQYVDDAGRFGYSKRLYRLTRARFYKHLDGKDFVAIMPVTKINNILCAAFLCLDIDERIEERLPILGAVLSRRKMLRAAIATTGSSSDRGKVIVFLEPALHCAAKELVDSVYEECKRDLLWGDEGEHKTDRFPKGGQGGTPVRLLGRNLKRTDEGHLDRLRTLDGSEPDLSKIVPYKIPGEAYSPYSYTHIRVWGIVAPLSRIAWEPFVLFLTLAGVPTSSRIWET